MPIEKENRKRKERMALEELEERLLNFFKANSKKMFAIDELPDKIKFPEFFKNSGRYEKEHHIFEVILDLERKGMIRSEYYYIKNYYGIKEE